MKIKEEQLKVIQDQQRELNAIMHEVGVLEAVSYTHLTLPTICSV